MANFLGKDQATYAKERDLFLRDIQHFHEARGTPFKRAPTLGGKEVDLYLLYTLVTSQGGWLRVNSKNTWSEILPFFKLPGSCVNGSVAIKQIYLRYLDRWEKVHFLHEDADRASDDDEESRHKRWSARSLHSVPCTYNYNQHNVTDANREHNHLSTNLYKQSDYDRLSLSLISPLPNEQDFAINVCTLLSNDGKHTLKLEKHPRLINYLLAHAGIFSHSSMRQLFTHFYNIIRKKPIHNFWKDVLESQEHLDLTNETKFKSIDPEVSSKCEPLIVGQEEESALLALNSSASLEDQTSENADSVDCEIVEENCDSFKLKLNPEDSELFSIKRSLGTQDYVGQRVLQIATILRNLSFIEENVPVLVKNTSFIRFLLLCSISRWNILRNLGMDMLSNVASEFIVRDLQSDLLATKLLKIVTNGLRSEDRAACISSLEVLNKLSQNEQNEDVMQRSLQKHVYKSVCSFLTLHDVMLLIYTLECLYSLSSLGERSCNFIIVNHGVIDTLVALITVEGKSYGPKACIGMKLVETLPSGSNQQTQVQQSPNQTQQTNQNSQNQSVSTTSSTVTISSASSTLTSISSNLTAITTTSAISTPVVSVSPTPKTAPSTPVRQVPLVPQRLIPLTSTPVTTTAAPSSSVIHSTSTIMTPQMLIQQQHAHQQAIHENEQFALAWLRATYEPCSTGRVDHQELYKHYLSSCSTIGRKGVISPLHFPRCVRSIFGGTVGPNPMKPTNANDPQFYDGIKVRDKPLIINLPPSSSPQPKIVTVPTPTKSQQVRRKSSVQPILVPPPGQSNALTVVADNNGAGMVDVSATPSPASPILKAQLSAPPKQRDASPVSGKGDMKSQAMAHPHLSQALLGSTATTTVTGTTTVTVSSGVGGGSKDHQTSAAGQTSNTSLIKSLLATKVNDCMSTVSMRTATDCQNVAQVAARQQRLLAQQGQQTSENQSKMTLKTARINGVRQLFTDSEIGDPSVSSTTQFTDLTKGKKEPPQPPPPPLAPLSNNIKRDKSQRIDNEDSDSIGNHSLASSSGIGTVGIGGVSSTEDGENSLTSFEGLLNGIPNIDNPLNEDSNSKDSVKIPTSEISMHKPLRLADLLEKKFEKSPPMLNGAMGKELRLGDKAMDLVENHIEKALSRDNNETTPEKCINMELKAESNNMDVEIKAEQLHREMIGLKRSASEEMIEIEAKRPLLSSSVNGSTADSPVPDSSSSNGDDGPSTVSTAAAKLFADIAADILEDEDEEQLLQEAQSGHSTQIVAEQQSQMQIQPQNPLQQIIMDNSQQVLLQQRQIIVSQAQLPTSNQMVFSTGTHLKTQTGQTVIVQNTSGQRPVMLTQQNTGQILLSQGLQGQMQIVASSQPGQYVLQTSGSGGQGAAYVVAQPQTALVHGSQPQTVLLAQTSQQQGTGAKTIIILQQQPSSGSATQHQKVVVTPQGQQVVVTQVPRPVMHTSSVSNNVSPVTKVIKTVASNNNTTQVQHSQQTSQPQQSPNVNIVMTDKKEDLKKHKIARDLTTPFICEWGDCLVDKRFKSANEVYLHACAAHCPSGSEEIICQWDRCDNMKRKRFSLMTHLHDKHCNTEAMKQSLLKRKQAAHSNKPEVITPAAPSPHPGYAPDAALHAIKRHALEFVNPKELQDDNEGPVTKSIRLTASLILRNLVIYSSHCKRYLKSYESHLANVALSNVESSRTIAQILFDMNDGSTHR